MKIEIRTTTTKQVEVQLPYYSLADGHFYKVYGTNNWDAICVSYPGEKACKIQNTLADHAFNFGAKQCTEDEFDFAYRTALDYIMLYVVT